MSVRELEELAYEAERRIPEQPTVELREFWIRKADECWRAVCDAEAQ